MSNVVKMTIQFRRDTTENWLLNKDIVPASGEPCYDINAKTLKVGDGSTTYENLPILGGVNVEATADGTSIVIEDGALKLAGFDAAEFGAYLRKSEDGKMEWVIPTNEELDDLKTVISGLQVDVDSMKSILTPTDDGVKPLLERVEIVEDKTDTLEVQVAEINETIEDVVARTVSEEVAAQIDDFATKVSDDEIINTFKELVDYVANHGGEVETLVNDISGLKSLVGEISVQEQIENAIRDSGHITEEELEPIRTAIDEISEFYLTKEEADVTLQAIEYEISHKPVGALVDYKNEEIRIMCPSDTQWVLQNSGEGENPSVYYIGLKAYAPNNAVSFKEDLAERISDDTMYYFEENDFAGTDIYGRKYSIVLLPVAQYDENTDTWAYYGDNSSVNEYVGWYYSVEWYDESGKVIKSDIIRINLSNANCHNVAEPYYMSDVVKGIRINGTLVDVVDNIANITVTTELKGSDEVTIAEDGTLGIGTISFSKIAQAEGEVIVLDGGASGVTL